jgi:hypothetical protein
MLSELSESDRETLTKALVPLERLASSPAFSLHRPVLQQSYPFEPISAGDELLLIDV